MTDSNNKDPLFDLFPFKDVPGLLTPEEQSNVKTNTMLSLAAGLLNASGYSPIPHSMLADFGKGLSGALQGYQEGMKSALTNEAMRGQIQDRQLARQNLLQQMSILHALAARNNLLPPGLLNPTGGATPAANSGSPAPSATPNAGAMPAGLLGPGGTTAPVAPATPNGAPAAPATAPAPVANSAGGIGAVPQPVMDAALLSKLGGIPGIADYVSKASLPTDQQKNARDPAVAAYDLQKAQQADDVTRFGKKYDSVTQAGDQASSAQPQIQLAKNLLNDPSFYSGTGEDLNLAYKKVLPLIGGDPNAAMPQEAFRGAIKSQILDTLRSLKGTGQIRVAELKLIQQALANPEHSISGNRMLVEIADRLNNRTLGMDDIARKYNGGSGHLDPGFDTAARQYDQDHQIFTSDELKDPRRIAPLTFKDPQAMLNASLPKGTPFRTPDGGWGYAP